MTYRDALEYINSFTDFEKLSSLRIEPFDLTRVRRLLGILGDPHLEGQTIHVAGTKGKGSTAAMLEAILRTQGYRSAFFTSPHLHSYRERIRVDGQPMSQEDLVALVQQVRPLIEEMHQEWDLGRITTFELTTILAFLYFRSRSATHRVIEAGLGGRLDATNVVEPLVAVLTSISLDHTSILGSTITEVAQEKAGIIKPGAMVVSAPQLSPAAEVIRQTCVRQGAHLIEVGRDVFWRRLSASLEGQDIQVITRSGEYHLGLPLLGRFQCENAAVAIAAVEASRVQGVEISLQSIDQGLRSVSWPGRMQLLQREPLVVVDGAHNIHSAAVLKEAVTEDLHFARCILVIGTSVDKDISGIAGELAPLAGTVIATRSRHPRSAAPDKLQTAFASLCPDVRTAPNLSDALSLALQIATPADLLLVTGSLFVVAEALEWYGQAGEMDPE